MSLISCYDRCFRASVDRDAEKQMGDLDRPVGGVRSGNAISNHGGFICADALLSHDRISKKAIAQRRCLRFDVGDDGNLMRAPGFL